MARKPRVKYEVYERWYDKYAASGEMKYPKMSEGAFMAVWKRASISGQEMRDFSRITAMRQRQASELQTRTTWGVWKGKKRKVSTIKEFKKDIKLIRKDFVEQELRDLVSKGNNLSEEEIKKAVIRIRKKGIPESVKEEAERKTRQYFLDEAEAIRKGMTQEQRDIIGDFTDKYTLIEDYGDMTYKQFKKYQHQIVKSARILTEDRTLWNEAFRLAFNSPKEK